MPDPIPNTKRIHCAACGASLKPFRYRDPRHHNWYCSQECYRNKPPKMIAAEEAWGKPIEAIMLDHLNRGGTVTALAQMLGLVDKGSIYRWFRKLGIRKVTRWEMSP